MCAPGAPGGAGGGRACGPEAGTSPVDARYRSMRIHHLTCGTHCPMGGALYDGFSRGPLGQLTCTVQLIETEQGLVLVDTGLGVDDVRRPYPRLSRMLGMMLNPQLSLGRTALHQVKALGFAPGDVRHIILTHLDFDHAGGIEDFPFARVHVMQAEREAAERQRRGFIASRRYRPAQWDEVREWRTYAGGGERWFGFDAVRDLDGLPPEILMVPLPGHTPGHAGVAVRADDVWILNAGDAYVFRHEMNVDRPHCTPGLGFYQRLMETDRTARLANQDRLRALKREHGEELLIFCSHDAKELEALQSVGPIDAPEARPRAWRTDAPKPPAAGRRQPLPPRPDAGVPGGFPLH